MAQYDLFPEPSGNGYLLDVQNDLLEGLNVRAVVPLLPQGKAPIAASRLNPAFQIDGAPYLMMTQYIAAVPVSILKAPVGDVSEDFDTVTAALDMLFHGFCSKSRIGSVIGAPLRSPSQRHRRRQGQAAGEGGPAARAGPLPRLGSRRAGARAPQPA